MNISYPMIRVSGGKKYLLFGKIDLLCFLETRVSRFALLPYYRLNLVTIEISFCRINFNKIGYT